MQVSVCVVCMCSLQMPIVRCLCAHSYSPPRSCHTHNSSRQDFKQRKKEKNAVLLFFLLFFFFLLSPPRRLNRGTSAGPQFFGGDYEKQLHKPPSAAHSRAEEKKSFASREEKEQKPSDARAVLNRCLPNCKGIVWLCVVAGREEAGGRGDGKRPPSHAGWGRPPATPI